MGPRHWRHPGDRPLVLPLRQPDRLRPVHPDLQPRSRRFPLRRVRVALRCRRVRRHPRQLNITASGLKLPSTQNAINQKNQDLRKDQEERRYDDNSTSVTRGQTLTYLLSSLSTTCALLSLPSPYTRYAKLLPGRPTTKSQNLAFHRDENKLSGPRRKHPSRTLSS